MFIDSGMLWFTNITSRQTVKHSFAVTFANQTQNISKHLYLNPNCLMPCIISGCNKKFRVQSCFILLICYLQNVQDIFTMSIMDKCDFRLYLKNIFANCVNKYTLQIHFYSHCIAGFFEGKYFREH